jgi:hypothetical protein
MNKPTLDETLTLESVEQQLVKMQDILTKNPFVILTSNGYPCACEKPAGLVAYWAVGGLSPCTWVEFLLNCSGHIISRKTPAKVP